jgi:hypothetical protein
MQETLREREREWECIPYQKREKDRVLDSSIAGCAQKEGNLQLSGSEKRWRRVKKKKKKKKKKKTKDESEEWR